MSEGYENQDTETHTIIFPRKIFKTISERVHFIMQDLGMTDEQVVTFYEDHKERVDTLHTIFTKEDWETKQLLLLSLYIFAADNWRIEVCKRLKEEEGIAETAYTNAAFQGEHKQAIIAALVFNVTFRAKTANLYELVLTAVTRDLRRDQEPIVRVIASEMEDVIVADLGIFLIKIDTNRIRSDGNGSIDIIGGKYNKNTRKITFSNRKALPHNKTVLLWIVDKKSDKLFSIPLVCEEDNGEWDLRGYIEPDVDIATCKFIIAGNL